MEKKQALELLGGTVAKAADVIGINSQAVSQWPDVLPRRISDRVLGACLRNGIVVPTQLLKPNMPKTPARIAQAATETVAQGVAHG